MVFVRSNLLGWAFGEVLTSAQMNALDINMTRALDGQDGGTYNPSAALTLNNQLYVDATASASSNAVGVEAQGKGIEPGVRGTGGSSGSVGVEGIAGGSSLGYGVYGLNDIGQDGIGVYGDQKETTGQYYGVYGASAGLGAGTAGKNTGAVNTNEDELSGVRGESLFGHGGWFKAASAPAAVNGRAAIHIHPQDNDPNPSYSWNGDLWFRDLHIKAKLNNQITEIIEQRNIRALKAMCTFNFGASYGTPTIRKSFNVASVAYNSGSVRVTFTTAMSDVNYAANVTLNSASGYVPQTAIPVTTYITCQIRDFAGTLVNMSTSLDGIISLLIFGDGGV